MRIRRTLAVVFGITQSFIALVAIPFAVILFFNFFDIQTLLNVTTEFRYFHLLALLIFGFLSLISGLFLVYEWFESR